MARRYELSLQQWERLKDSLPGKAGDRGRTAVDNRPFANGVLWVLRSGVQWCDLHATATGRGSINALRAGRSKLRKVCPTSVLERIDQSPDQSNCAAVLCGRRFMKNP